MKKLILLLTATACISSVFGQKVNNKLNFKPGQLVEITSTVNSTITQEAMGQSIDIKVDGSILHTYRATNFSSGNTTLNHETRRITINVDGMGESRSFDSDKKEDLEGEMGASLKQILAKTFEMTVDPTGKVVAVKQSETPAGTEASADMINNLLNEISSSLDAPKVGDASFFKVLPDREVGKGDTWNDSTSTEQVKSKTVYTITDITPTEILVDFTIHSNTEAKGEIMGMETLTMLTSKITGKMTIDRATGILKVKTSDTDSSGNVEVMGQSIPLTSKSTSVVTVK